MSDTTTPLLSAVDIETHALDLTESTFLRIRKLNQDEYLAVAKSCIEKGIELASAKLLAENAALRERLAVLEGQGVEPWPIVDYRTNPDDAAAPIILSYLRRCALSWEPEVRLLGNLRSCDLVRVLNELERGPSTTKSDASLRAAAQVAADAGVAVIQKMWEANDMAVLGEWPSDAWHAEKKRAIEQWDTALTALAEQGVKPTLKP